MRKLAVTLGLCLAVIGSVFADDTPRFKITTKRSVDRVEVKSEEDGVLFKVRSPSGIGSAIIERNEEQWPDKVLVQLQLNGLESFNASTDKLKLEASISSQTGDLRLEKDGKEVPQGDSKSPYEMKVRMLDKDGEPTKEFPFKDGWFEIHLPKSLFEDNPKSIKLNWIDYYRN